MRWVQADHRNPPKEPGYYIVKVIAGTSPTIPFMPYIVVRIGVRKASWGPFIEKNGWEPTWYFRVEEEDQMRQQPAKPPSIFDKELTYEERKLLK